MDRYHASGQLLADSELKNKKRKWTSLEDDSDIFHSPLGSSTPQSAVVEHEFSMPSAESLALPELLSSILGVKDKRPGNGLSEVLGQLPETALDASDDQYALLQPSFEESAVADFSRSVEVWAKNASNARSNIGYPSPSLETDSEQCYGMIHGCEARLIYNMPDLRIRLAKMFSVGKWASFKVSFMSSTSFLNIDETVICGQLRDGLYDPLHQVCDTLQVRLAAYALIGDCLRVIDRAKKPHEAAIKVDINVYGPPDARADVGRILSLDKLYLQNPQCGCTGIEYRNPHMLLYQDIDLMTLPREQQGPLPQIDDPKEILRTIFEVCNAETRDEDVLDDSQDLVCDADLFPHQSRAVDFMIEREVGPIHVDRKLWQPNLEDSRSGFRHIVTGGWSAEAHLETGGGLLADDMGMGKTRSILSLVSKRVSAARDWSKLEHDSVSGMESENRFSKATLVVVPSLLIMNDCWIREVETLNNSLQYFKYHGKGRKDHSQLFFDSDIVLTTYHTLAAERRSKRPPMNSIKWFRIVLDEAHTIRRQATGLHAAVAELDACYRWCLSGTPIQNQLDDLGTLLAFLHIEPFDNISVFRKYIAKPFSPFSPFIQDLPAAKLKLSLLLKSMCIRRRRERLHLPPLDEVPRHVQLSERERHLYERTQNSMSYTLSHGSRETNAGTPFGRFQIQLQLRRLCNHGTFQKAWTSGEDDMQTQKEDVLSSIGKDGEVRCSACHEMTLILATNCAATRKLPSCTHVLCNDCVSQLSEEVSNPLSTSDCQYCRNQCSSTGLKVSTTTGGTSLKKPDFLATGHSSKMEALMADVRERLHVTKSIVFSTWTRSLDLVQRHLGREGLTFVRIDGDTALTRRQKILNDFTSNNDVRILLMTTGTGAYGLNLPVANRIFILEPQWNPSIEVQAIARAMRPGQRESVRVTRYIVSGSVEEDIRKQQDAKVQVAEAGFHHPD